MFRNQATTTSHASLKPCLGSQAEQNYDFAESYLLKAFDSSNRLDYEDYLTHQVDALSMALAYYRLIQQPTEKNYSRMVQIELLMTLAYHHMKASYLQDNTSKESVDITECFADVHFQQAVTISQKALPNVATSVRQAFFEKLITVSKSVIDVRDTTYLQELARKHVVTNYRP
jgi:hypothetical protein